MGSTKLPTLELTKSGTSIVDIALWLSFLSLRFLDVAGNSTGWSYEVPCLDLYLLSSDD